jgi:THAP4-like, heme-binding beta-barrel domain
MKAINETRTPAHGLPFTRLSPSLAHASDGLGPLADLVGTWVGNKGVNMVAVPFPTQGNVPFTLLVTPYLETITFSPIGAKVPNRRAGGVDYVVGVMYELRNIDISTNQPMHVENGMLLLLDPVSKKNSVARLASVPHGDSVLAIGDWGRVDGPPIFPPIWSLPSDQDPSQMRQYESAKTAQFDPKVPEATLASELAGQKILHTTFINLSTGGGGGILNIPFIARQANARRFACNLWIETIADPKPNPDPAKPAHSFQQLQYAQTTIIEFRDDQEAPRGRWPHVNINTLVKQ